MKRKIAMVLLAAMLVCAAAGMAEGAGGQVLREGKYIIGEDIAAGTYTLTCIETVGDQLNEAYGALGSMMDALDGKQGYGSMFGAFGDMFGAYMDMTVEIVGDYGDVLKRFTLKAGDSMSVTLSEKTALRIADGSCSIAAAG